MADMTEDQQDAAIGKLTRAYLGNERHIAAICSTLQQAGADLEWLGRLLASSVRHVRVAEDGKTFMGHQVHGDRRVTVDVDLLADNARALEKAYKRKAEMETCLKQAGMQDLIRAD